MVNKLQWVVLKGNIYYMEDGCHASTGICREGFGEHPHNVIIDNKYKSIT